MISRSNVAKFHTDNITDASNLNNSGGHGGGFSKEIHFHNDLHRDITVVNRDGTKVGFGSSPRPKHGYFTVRVVIEINDNVKLNTEDLLSSKFAHSKVLLNIIDTTPVINTYPGGKRYIIDHHISVDDLKANNGSIYLDVLDIVITLKKGDSIPFHPYSEKGIEAKHISNKVKKEGSVLTYGVKIIDSKNKFGDRYVNINGRICHIEVSDEDADDGVYIILNDGKEVEYYKFKEVDDSFELYLSAEEARVRGDKENNIKELENELAEQTLIMKKNNLILEGELKDKELKYKKEAADAKAKMSEMEDEMSRRSLYNKEKYDYRSLDRKDHYEDQGAIRKNGMEVLKFIPAIIMGVSAIYLAFSNSKK